MPGTTDTHWPYPALFAHRGGGAFAPENTLAAFDTAHRLGLSAVEFDVQLSADYVPVLIHDATLARTTNGRGRVASRTLAELSRLDAGSRFAEAFAGEPLPSLDAAALACRQLGLVANIEIKPDPARTALTGTLVGERVSRLWAGAGTWPLISSFSLAALYATKEAAPQLPLAWLVERWPEHWAEQLDTLDAVALHVEHSQLSAERVRQVKDAGYHLLAYTVNDAARARELLAMGVDGLFTDALDALPASLLPQLLH